MHPAGSEPAPHLFSRLEPPPVPVPFPVQGVEGQRPEHGLEGAEQTVFSLHLPLPFSQTLLGAIFSYNSKKSRF